jgi:hypothetical protein
VREEREYWTVEEARGYLPRLRALLQIIRRSAALATHVRSNGHASLQHGHPSAESEDLAASDGPLPQDLASALAELEDRRIVLRDPERGLIDFPAIHLGREVQLCWELGEEELDWWHLPEAGFGGRQRLPLPPSW